MDWKISVTCMESYLGPASNQRISCGHPEPFAVIPSEVEGSALPLELERPAVQIPLDRLGAGSRLAEFTRSTAEGLARNGTERQQLRYLF